MQHNILTMTLSLYNIIKVVGHLGKVIKYYYQNYQLAY